MAIVIQTKAKWQAVILVCTLGTTRIISNLHTGQYPSGVLSDHSQGHALVVKPLSLPWVTKHINKFLYEVAHKGGSGIAIHTNGFNCDWLKKIILEVIVILALCSLL